MKSDISRYISCTRYNSAPNAILVKQYTDNFHAIVTSLRTINITPSLFAVYSKNRESELIELDEQIVVIHDQYLGQTINMLNRLFFNTEGAIEYSMYFYKIYAEYLQLSGSLNMALYCANKYAVMETSCRSHRLDKKIEYRHFNTAVHEFFIIWHEVAHFLMMVTPKIKRKFFSVDGINRVRNRTYRYIDAIFDDDETVSRLKKSIDNIGLVEECLCDDIAIYYALQHFRGRDYKLKMSFSTYSGYSEFSFKEEDILKAFYLFFCNITLLDKIRLFTVALVSPTLTDSVMKDKFSIPSIRLINAENAIRSLDKLADEDFAIISERILKSEYAIIDIFAELNEQNRGHTIYSSRDYRELNRVIDSLTNWGPSNTYV